MVTGTVKSSNIAVIWNKVEDARGYDVYFAKIYYMSSDNTEIWNKVEGVHGYDVYFAKIYYMLSDKKVVTVDKNGKVRAVGQGRAYVYAYVATACMRKWL